MLQVAVDESGRNEDFFVVAGYIAPARVWAEEFVPAWKKLVDLGPPHHSRIKAFHMTEMTGDPERCMWFYRVIEDHVTAEISCTISVQGLLKAFREYPWPVSLNNTQVFTDPYYLGFRNIVFGLARHQGMLGIDEPVDFIFDNVSEKRKCLVGWDRMIFMASEKERRLVGEMPIFRKDEEFLPLQAADLYAYWVREWELRGFQDQPEKMRFPWPRKRSIPRLAMRFEEQHFIEEWDGLIKNPENFKRLMMSDEELGIE